MHEMEFALQGRRQTTPLMRWKKQGWQDKSVLKHEYNARKNLRTTRRMDEMDIGSGTGAKGQS
jgi:hypothetical protein